MTPGRLRRMLRSSVLRARHPLWAQLELRLLHDVLDVHHQRDAEQNGVEDDDVVALLLWPPGPGRSLVHCIGARSRFNGTGKLQQIIGLSLRRNQADGVEANMR